jgi:protein translocase SecG subunit
MQNYLPYIEIGISIILIILILIQQKGTALGSSFGQAGGSYGTARGAEKKIFWLTCVFGSLFIIFAFLTHIL